MSADIMNDNKDAAMLTAMHMLAEKYGCKMDIDPATHTVNFDCPTKKAETDLAMEVSKLMAAAEEN